MQRHFLFFLGFGVLALFHAYGQGESGMWPALEPRESGYLRVSDLHELFYECSGNPDGLPLVILHGGPGGGSSPIARRLCDPAVFNIIQFDQRGAGRSKPYGELRENTTWDLVDDIEKLRMTLGIDSMVLFGGSWGSTLALAYAQRYPRRVCALVFRGVFLGTDAEIDHLYHGGLAKFFPDLYEELLTVLPDRSRRPLPGYLAELLQQDDSLAVLRVARAWAWYETAASAVDRDSTRLRRVQAWLETGNPLAFALFENVYMAHRCWLGDDELLRNAGRIAHIPAWIVNGRYDVVCPPEAAWRLHRALPLSTLLLTPASGHSASEPETQTALLRVFHDIEARFSAPAKEKSHELQH